MINEQFKNYLIRKYPQSKTISNYLERLNNFFSKYREFNQDNVDKYLTYLASKGKLNSQKMAIYAFKQYSEFSSIPIQLTKAPKIQASIGQNYLTFDEVKKEIIPYFPSLFKDDYKLCSFIVRFMVLSMLRISEVVALKKKDINLKDARINVIDGKGRKHRCVPIHSSLKKELQYYIDKSEGERLLSVDKLFIEHILREINETLRYKKRITPHSLRRSGAKAFYKQTKDVRALQKILGHSSMDTTQLYIGYDIDDIEESFKNFKY